VIFYELLKMGYKMEYLTLAVLKKLDVDVDIIKFFIRNNLVGIPVKVLLQVEDYYWGISNILEMLRNSTFNEDGVQY